MNADIEYDFVPQTVSVARFSDNGFVSCKYKYDKWMNVSIFERLCKFKPNDQRDPEKQLKKAIYNAVSVIDNEPISGFTVVDHDKDLYKRYYHNCNDIILLDPRGFKIAVFADNFWYMLKCAGMNLKDGVIEHKFAYAWTSGSHFKLVDAETEEFKKVKAHSDTFKTKIDNNVYVTKKQLKVGKIYAGSGKMRGLHMYLGEFEVYDTNYHKDALNAGCYQDIDAYCKYKMYDDITNKNRLVFYRIDRKDKYEKLSAYPFEFKSSISKMLEREVDDGNEDIELLPMFNDETKPSTYENIKEFMKTCPLFNKIDFSSYQEGVKKCPKELFVDILRYTTGGTYGKDPMVDAYPFNSYGLYNCGYLVKTPKCVVNGDIPWGYGNASYSYAKSKRYNNTYVRISSYSSSYKIEAADNDDTAYWSRRTYDTLNCSISDLYEVLNPHMAVMKYENGEYVSDIHVLLMQRNRECTR